MFDIFLIVLLLVVTSDCVLVATRPLVGALCFLTGVCCTLVAGQRDQKEVSVCVAFLRICPVQASVS